jgi:ABC-2 type transport system permease protein
MFSVFILSVICAVVAAQIFRDSIDDGSELVVVSKPISRWKLILGKFIVFWLTMFVILLINCFIVFIGACIKNSFADFPKTVGKFFLGSIISSMLFGAIAILIGCFRTKVVILCSTIGLGVVLNVMNTILPLISNSPISYLKDKYGYKTQSVILVDKDGEERSYVAIKDLQKDNAMSTYDFLQEADKKSAVNITNILNIGGQLTDAYYLAPEDIQLTYSPYGFSSDEHYEVHNNK